LSERAGAGAADARAAHPRGSDGRVADPRGSDGRAEAHSGPRGLPVAAARRVRLVLLDVDGVLTDNGLYLGARGGEGSAAAAEAGRPAIELKRFHIHDGVGVLLLLGAGIAVELLSGRESPATALRARELGVRATQVDGGFKLGPAEERLAEHGLGWEEVAVVGDDLADLPLLRRAGLPVAVANAVAEVRAQAAWITTRAGGDGAVREFVHALLEARGEREEAVARYERARAAEVEEEVSRAG